MDDQDRRAELFEGNRAHLRAVAYRMLGSAAEAEDAVQEAWIRFGRADTGDVENLRAWLTTVVARICLTQLAARRARPEEPLAVHVPDPVLAPAEGGDPEGEAVLADSVGLALLVVLETLAPPERLAYVLHDMFGVPFDEIAPMVGRSSQATRQLASRARRRVRGEAPDPDPDPRRQREVVDAFLAASRRGDFDALVAVLHPDVVLRSDGGALEGASAFVRGARTVAGRAVRFAHLSPWARPVLVNGVAGLVVAPEGTPTAVMAFTVVDGRIAAITALTDPERLARLDLEAIGGG